MSTMHFGKYQGCKIAAIPSDYLIWLINNSEMDDHLYDAITEELDNRDYSGTHIYERD